jgi:ATP-dependent Clp protease adaptor protein ClpS
MILKVRNAAESPLIAPAGIEWSLEKESGRQAVIIFNNDHNNVEEVIAILMVATGCSIEEAEIETWEAHTFGETAVHFADLEECEAVARVISRIGVRTEIRPEWKN